MLASPILMKQSLWDRDLLVDVGLGRFGWVHWAGPRASCSPRAHWLCGSVTFFLLTFAFTTSLRFCAACSLPTEKNKRWLYASEEKDGEEEGPGCRCACPGGEPGSHRGWWTPGKRGRLQRHIVQRHPRWGRSSSGGFPLHCGFAFCLSCRCCRRHFGLFLPVRDGERVSLYKKGMHFCVFTPTKCLTISDSGLSEGKCQYRFLLWEWKFYRCEFLGRGCTRQPL